MELQCPENYSSVQAIKHGVTIDMVTRLEPLKHAIGFKIANKGVRRKKAVNCTKKSTALLITLFCLIFSMHNLCL
jgi:hypothetical protein